MKKRRTKSKTKNILRVGGEDMAGEEEVGEMEGVKGLSGPDNKLGEEESENGEEDMGDSEVS